MREDYEFAYGQDTLEAEEFDWSWLDILYDESIEEEYFSGKEAPLFG